MTRPGPTACVLACLAFLAASPAPAGSVRTVAGGGSKAVARGLAGTEACLDRAWTVRVAPDGSLHFNHQNPPQVVRLDPRGTIDRILPGVPTLWVDDLRVERGGSVLAVGSEVVYRIRPDGAVETVAGRRGRALASEDCAPAPDGSCPEAGDGGLAGKALLAGVQGVAVDRDGNIFLQDQKAAVIRRIDRRTGIITRVAGKYFSSVGSTGDGGPALSATITPNNKIAVDRIGHIFLSDRDGVRKIDAKDNVITRIASGLVQPHGVDVDGWGNVYVTDTQAPDGTSESGSVYRIDAATGAMARVAGSNAGGPVTDHPSDPLQATFRFPEAVTVDRDGQLYVLNFSSPEGSFGRIQRVAFDPSVEQVASPSGPAAAGGVVTLKGRYFNSKAGTVRLGSRPAKIRAWSNTEIRFRVPQGTPKGTHTVTVTNSDGLTGTATYTVTK